MQSIIVISWRLSSKIKFVTLSVIIVIIVFKRYPSTYNVMQGSCAICNDSKIRTENKNNNLEEWLDKWRVVKIMRQMKISASRTKSKHIYTCIKLPAQLSCDNASLASVAGPETIPV